MKDFQSVIMTTAGAREVFGDRKVVADSITAGMESLQGQADEALHVPMWGTLRTKIDWQSPHWLVTCTVSATETAEAYEARTGQKVKRGY